MGHVSNKPDQQRHFMPLSTTVRNISYIISIRHTLKGLHKAWVYVKYASEPAYFAAEKAAKAAQIGLWSQPNPIPPWDYRHGGQTSTVNGQPANKNASCGQYLRQSA